MEVDSHPPARGGYEEQEGGMRSKRQTRYCPLSPSLTERVRGARWRRLCPWSTSPHACSHLLSSELCSRSSWISRSLHSLSCVRRAIAVAILSSSSARMNESSLAFSAWEGRPCKITQVMIGQASSTCLGMLGFRQVSHQAHTGEAAAMALLAPATRLLIQVCELPKLDFIRIHALKNKLLQ